MLCHALCANNETSHAVTVSSPCKVTVDIGALTELFDSIIPTIEKQALTLGLELHKPRRDSSVYAGFIVGMDRHRMLIRYGQQRATFLDFSELPELTRLPRLGDQLRVTFRHGALSLTIIPSSRPR